MNGRIHFGTQIEQGLRDRVSATVIGLQRIDPTFTLTRFTSDALTAWCERMEAEHNDGQQWEVLPGVRPSPGRRISPPATYSAE